MTVQYRLEVDKDMSLVPFEQRKDAQHDLVVLAGRNHLFHQTLNEADKAAKAISKSPIVSKVTLTRVETSAPIIYKNGEKDPH